MTISEAMQARHSVRSYREDPICQETVERLEQEIQSCKKESGLGIFLVTQDPAAFDGLLAHYGKFTGVRNYIAITGKKSPDLDERVGYYGQRLVLLAQTLGLNTCWVAMTVSKGAVKKQIPLAPGERLAIVIALGYGATQGTPRRSKPMEALCAGTDHPDWFRRGMAAAMLAPTAMNQQKFYLEREGRRVRAKATGGFYSRMDLGIVKYHFEQGAGKENFTWA